MTKSKDYYPYRDVKIPIANNITAILKLLRSVGACEITTSHDEPAVGFKLAENLYVVDQDIDWFISKGSSQDKAQRQAWSAIRDYIKALAVRLQTAESSDVIKLLATHLQLPGSIARSVGETIQVAANNNSLQKLIEENL